MARRFKIVDLGGDDGREIEVVEPGYAPVQQSRVQNDGEAEFTIQDNDKIEIRTAEAAPKAEEAKPDAGGEAGKGQEPKPVA